MAVPEPPSEGRRVGVLDSGGVTTPVSEGHLGSEEGACCPSLADRRTTGTNSQLWNPVVTVKGSVLTAVPPE